MEKSDSSTELALANPLSNREVDVLKLDFSNDMTGSLELLTSLVKSKKLGAKVNTPEVALGYYIKSKELGLPFISSIDHMFDVGGKTNIDVHLMRAMVLRAGVVYWETINNFAPLYKYIDGTGTVIAVGFDDECLPDTYEVAKGNTLIEKTDDANRIKSIGNTPLAKKVHTVEYSQGKSIINRGTRYKFTRIIMLADGTSRTLTEMGEFTVAEAIDAGLHLKKDGSVSFDSPWLKYPRNMLEHRAWTFGCRKIADDITFGLMERTEYLDMNKINYAIEEGKAVVSDAASVPK